ncbi:MAG: SDR family NAD(P)-dependent oxidoreductase [Bacteroidales bacterium]|nr:SDR family NAD(P)-dependent oxidoreductase [Bacteroidales bacterium]
MKKELIILTPFEIPDSKLVVEIAKTHAYPVLHLGSNKKAAQPPLDILSKKKISFGVCVASEKVSDISLPENVDRVILPLGVDFSTKRKVEYIYQVYSIEEAFQALEAKKPSIIIKGNEGAGRVSMQSSFIFFQALIDRCLKEKVKLYVQGGAGIHTSAAFLALGAHGVIMDSQVAVFPESSTPKEIKDLCKKLSGTETVLIDGFRVLRRNNSPKIPLNALAQDINPFLGGFNLSENYIPMGQDIALASDFAERYRNIKSFVEAFFEAVYGHILQAKRVNVIGVDNDLAKELHIKYPIAQGPMARISDVPGFLNEVSEAGGLPFFAMSMMTGDKARNELNNTAKTLAGKPWGVGILGFALPHIREEQTKYILEAKPDVVLIAGGRPSLAKPFEKEGIKTFIHVPSVSLLDIFLKEGAKNFIFEGRESGGHVGPLLSLVLWEKQIHRLLKEDDRSQLNVFFAGGIHDRLSSAFVSVMAANLAAKGVKTGVLMGTSYLYTKEIVASGAITKDYQDILIKKNETILLETAPGQETRSVESPYTGFFIKEKKKLHSEGVDPVDALIKLEELNLGRLRIAAKGLERKEGALIKLSKKEQLDKGLFMTGEVTSLINKVTSIAELHSDVAEKNKELIHNIQEISKPDLSGQPLDIAIVGMECIFPEAENIEEYWKNIVLGKDCMSEVPDSRWNKNLFYNPDTNDTDYVWSKWGGFIPTVDFDPLEFGMTPQSLASIEPVQLLSLMIAKRALQDAGYTDLTEVDMENTSVIFGAEGATELAMSYSFRSGVKQIFGELPDEVKSALPRLNSDSFAGILSNVISGRIANRLNLGGRNYTVDAACASSLAALDIACQELHSNHSDMVIVGGADLHNGANDFLLFASTYALSKKGYCATFDADSDGIALGEGIGVLILKRLEDAERDGNKIYAVIKGVGGSSDGKNLGMTAPSKKGQMRALERAYKNAGILPTEVELIEAHGTGTVVGDRTEVAALNDLFIDAGALTGQTFLGSVKTQIGHTKCSAGISGLIKAVCATYYGIMPPTIHLQNPISNYKAHTSPFAFRTVTGLWNREKRVAGISAFGFGGTNFHAVIENYHPSVPEYTSLEAWPSELFVFRGNTPEEAKKQVEKISQLLAINDSLKPKDLAFSLTHYSDETVQISVVAGSIQELQLKLNAVKENKTDSGIYYRSPVEGKVAFLFSGQGSQRVNMGRDLFVAFPRMRHLLNKNKEYEKILFPETVFDEESVKEQQRIITDTRNAQPLLGMVDWGIADYLRYLEIEPDMVAGHSYGEVAALCFAEGFSPEDLTRLSRLRAESILNAVEDDPGKMLAVGIPEEELETLLKDETEVWAVNFNSHKQIVLAGTTSGVEVFKKKLTEHKIAYKELNVACAFHSPVVAKAKDLYSKVLKDIPFTEPQVPVWSNTTAGIYPDKISEIKERLAEHLVRPVLFTKQIENMYADRARIFIETGPGRTLTGLVTSVLGKDAIALSTENKGNEGVSYLLKAIAQYMATGKNVNINKLFEGRRTSYIDIDNPEKYKKADTLWKINGHNAVPYSGKMPADGAYPVTQPIIQLKELMETRNLKKDIENNIAVENIMMEYLANMKSVIQDQRDVMLGYLGQYDIAPRSEIQRTLARQAVLQQDASYVAVEELSKDTLKEESGKTQNPLSSLTEEELKNILLEVVSDKTGYPIEMLGMDMDLEADLSIDSIKRMEIIGGLRDKFEVTDDIDESEDGFAKLASIKTLNQLIAWLKELGESAGNNVSGELALKPGDTEITPHEEIREESDELTRMRFQWVPYPFNPEKRISVQGNRFAVVEHTNENSVSSAVKMKLENEGAQVDILDIQTNNLKDYKGIILLSSSKSPIQMKELFTLLKSIDWNHTTKVFIFSDALGSILKSKNTKSLKKIQGYPGLMKSLAHEYPSVNFRVIECWDSFNKNQMPEIILEELSADEKTPEIIYKKGERCRFEVKAEILTGKDEGNLSLDPESTVLVLGGAQGITPELVSQMANLCPCNYILVGRSTLETEGEDKYEGLNTKDEIRKFLIQNEELKVPAEIEKKVQTLFKRNQVKRAVARIKNAGGKVVYRTADVKNTKVFKALIKDIQKEYGKIDVVIHAAGILEDKLFADKTWESFENVYQTKIVPLNSITDELLPELKLLVLFSSVASAFGNRGQTDYAAANSVFDLTSLLWSEKKINIRILSFNWGPWKGAGMVSDSLENEFRKRGVAMISLKEGGEIFVNELQYGKEPSVLVMGGKSQDIENFLEAIK